MDRLIALLKRLALRVARVAIDEAIDGALDEIRAMASEQELGTTSEEQAAIYRTIGAVRSALKARF